MTLGQAMQGLACEVLLGDLALERDAVGVLAWAFILRRPGTLVNPERPDLSDGARALVFSAGLGRSASAKRPLWLRRVEHRAPIQSGTPHPRIPWADTRCATLPGVLTTQPDTCPGIRCGLLPVSGFVHNKLAQAKFEIRSVVASEPSLAALRLPISWWQQYKILRYYSGPVSQCVVGRHTEFVLDGFQGSANSFAAAAFERSQARPVMMAHHMHSPAQIIKAVQMGLPIVVTVREPSGAVVSLTTRWPDVTLSQALRGYIRFYEKIATYAQNYVISPFEMTIHHLDQVVHRVNQRFGTAFDLVDHDDLKIKALRSSKAVRSSKEDARTLLKAERSRELREASHRRLLERAQAVYKALECQAAFG